MKDILLKIADRLEKGKVDAGARHPKKLAGQDGVDELVHQALEGGLPVERILNEGLVAGMGQVGEKFRDGELFLPDVLMAARAMTAGMKHLESYFTSGEVRYKGIVVMGTVAGDLHDIGKRIVSMFLEGGGWKVVDLGVDVSADKYLAAIEEHRPLAVGLSALLATTMVNMEEIARAITSAHPDVQVIVGGAPVNPAFAEKIGAHAYSPNPQGALDFLNQQVST